MLDVALKFSTRQGLAKNKYSIVLFFRWKIETYVFSIYQKLLFQGYDMQETWMYGHVKNSNDSGIIM